MFFFFFQAEDGIRDWSVTGVQTCALPIWSWSFPGGVPATSTDQNPKVEFPNSGNYTVTLEVTNSAGSNSISQINYITVLAAPTASFSSVVSDNQVSFTNLSSGGDSYLWEFGDGSSSTEVNPTQIGRAHV